MAGYWLRLMEAPISATLEHTAGVTRAGRRRRVALLACEIPRLWMGGRIRCSAGVQAELQE